ncbi:MAG: radical SAM protein [Desulfatiglandaceae bacterium]
MMIPSLGKLVILHRWLFTEQATSAAIDVTHRCNLHCTHCYWWKQEHPRELGDAEMIAFMKGLRSRGLRAVILYGGEPTLRPEVCRAASEIFDATLAFTNGTNGFPEMRNGQWILSLDGPREVNDSIRGAGVYDRAVANLFTAKRAPIVHMTISSLNRNSIEAFVKEMLELPIKGMGFSFLTPNLKKEDGDLSLPLVERDRIVENILKLRARYGEKIGFTPAMGRQLKSNGDFGSWNSRAACPVGRRVLCYQADGREKACTYGNQADCSRCGCAAVAVFRGAFRPFDLKTVRLILGLVMPRLNPIGGKRKGHQVMA